MCCACLLRSVGLKYEKAKEWKIPCVNAQWLCDVLLGNFDALRQIQHSRYSVFTHPEPLAPNPQLVHNLLGRYRPPSASWLATWRWRLPIIPHWDSALASGCDLRLH